MRWPFNWKETLALFAFLLVFSLFWLWLAHLAPEIFRENGPMENFQTGCLFIGCLLFLRAIAGLRDPADRILMLGLLLFYGTFLVRELDLREFDLPRINRVLRGSIRNAWVGGLWAIGFFLFVRNARNVWDRFVRWLPTRGGCLLVLAAPLWFLGALFDKLKPFANPAHNFMAEELMEANGALLMLLCALLTRKSHKDPSGQP